MAASSSGARSGAGPNRGFLARITAATALGEGLDGYDLGTISIVLVSIESAFHLDSVQEGLLGASSLIGIFAGGLFFGWLSDRIGRRNLFVFDLVAFAVIGALQMLSGSFLVLFVLRIALGLAIGAEYAIGETMLAETVPSSGRGWRLSSLQATWYGGYLLAVLVAYVLKGLGVDWRFILATGVVPGVVTLILRQGLPESPRWLASVGRVTEARAIVDRYLGSDYYDEENLGAEPERENRLGPAALFTSENWRRTLFGSLFFTCVVTPYFAIATFAPTVFSALGYHDPKVNVIATNAVAFLGALAGMFLIERLGRRPLLIWSFWAMLITIGIAGAWVSGPSTLIIVCLLGFAFTNAIGGDLCGVYPAELFPSDLRSSGVGFAAAMSRVGAAGGTFLLPIFISDFGIGTSLLISAAVCLLGLIVTYWLAPETTGRSLGEFARGVGPALSPAPAGG